MIYTGKLVLSEIICNTSPLQYLSQLALLDVIPKLTQRVYIPPAVVEEIETGKKYGISLPDVNRISHTTENEKCGVENSR